MKKTKEEVIEKAAEKWTEQAIEEWQELISIKRAFKTAPLTVSIVAATWVVIILALVYGIFK